MSLVLINKPIALVKLQGVCLLKELKQGSILVGCFDNGMLAAGRLDCRNGKVGIAAHGVVSCVEAQRASCQKRRGYCWGWFGKSAVKIIHPMGLSHACSVFIDIYFSWVFVLNQPPTKVLIVAIRICRLGWELRFCFWLIGIVNCLWKSALRWVLK